MARTRWLLVAIVLAIPAPWDQAEAVRVERGGSPRPAGIVRESEGAARVGVQLDRTRRMLELVRHRSDRCGSAEARDAVRRAAEMQDRAESAARAGRRLGALQLTRAARARGVAALRYCGHAGGEPEGLVIALDRTEELLDVARQRRAGEPSAPPGDRAVALERAAEAQRRALAEFRDGRLESSLRLTQEARRSLRPAGRDDADEWRDGVRPGAAPAGAVREARRRETPRREAPAPAGATRARPRRD